MFAAGQQISRWPEMIGKVIAGGESSSPVGSVPSVTQCGDGPGAIYPQIAAIDDVVRLAVCESSSSWEVLQLGKRFLIRTDGDVHRPESDCLSGTHDEIGETGASSRCDRARCIGRHCLVCLIIADSKRRTIHWGQ